MIRYQLKYGITASLEVTNTDEYKSIAFTLQHPKAQEYFLPALQREIESLTGYHGHSISLDSITIPDFVKVMDDLEDAWKATLIEGEDLPNMRISKIPKGMIS